MRKYLSMVSFVFMATSVLGMDRESCKPNRQTSISLKNATQPLNSNRADIEKEKDDNIKRLIIATKIPGRSNCVAKMRELLNQGADPTFEINGETALSVAIKLNDIEKIELLLKFGNDGYLISDIIGQNEQISQMWDNIKKERKKLRSAIVNCNNNQKKQKKLRNALSSYREVNSYICPNRTPLMVAVEEGNLLAVIEILKMEGVNVDQKNDYGNTALMIAAEYNRCAIAKMLISKGADVDSQNINGETPLKYAAHEGYEGIVDLLIQGEAVPDLKDKYGCTALWTAARNNNIGVVKKLIKHYSSCGINDTNVEGNTPLMAAASEDYIDIVEELLGIPDIRTDTVNKEGLDIFTLATQNNSIRTVKLLLDKFGAATMNKKDKEGVSLVHLAVIEGHSELLNLFLEYKDDEGNIIADLNTLDRAKVTPLMVTIRDDMYTMSNKLLDQDSIDVMKREEYGQTALYYAVVKKSKDIAEKILRKVPKNERKKYINIENASNTSVLNFIISNNNEEMLKLFLNYEADQVAALYYAILYGKPKMVDLLLKYGVDADAEFQGTPVLAYAVALGYTEIVKLLLDSGADVTKNVFGGTVLEIAQGFKHREEIIRLLKNAAIKQGMVLPPEPISVEPLKLSAEEVNSRFIDAFNDRSEEEMYRLLQQHDSDGNRLVSNESVDQVFLEVARKGYAGILDLLLPYVKDLNVRDIDGNTALILVAKAGHDPLLAILLNYFRDEGNCYVGIDIDAENNKGETALMVAMDLKHKEAVRKLQNYGAKTPDDTKSKYVQKRYGKDSIRLLLSENEKISNFRNKMMVSASFPVYAGNKFSKQLSELDADPGLKYLAEKARKMLRKLTINPYYAPENDEHLESLGYGCYSRRLNDKHRFIYRILGGVVQCLFCKDHNRDLNRSDKAVISSMVCKYKWEHNEKGKYDLVLVDRRDVLDSIADS